MTTPANTESVIDPVAVDPVAVDPIQQRRSRKLMLAMFAAFLFPVVMAQLAYTFGWLTPSATNKGALITPPVAIDALQLLDAKNQAITQKIVHKQKQWLLLYIVPENCDAGCRNALIQIRQLRQATGKEMDRVARLVISTHGTLDNTLPLQAAEDLHLASGNSDNINSALQRAIPDASTAGHVFFVDPMGFIMLHYPPKTTEQEAIMQGRDMLKDLQKLLKASQIG